MKVQLKANDIIYAHNKSVSANYLDYYIVTTGVCIDKTSDGEFTLYDIANRHVSYSIKERRFMFGAYIRDGVRVCDSGSYILRKLNNTTIISFDVNAYKMKVVNMSPHVKSLYSYIDNRGYFV